jgi:hypothetical protein
MINFSYFPKRSRLTQILHLSDITIVRDKLKLYNLLISLLGIAHNRVCTILNNLYRRDIN